MSRALTLRLDDDTYAVFAEAAKAEDRSIASLIRTAALAKVRERQFVDDFEMAEIRGNEDLQKRLRSGSRDARRMKGRLAY